MTHAEQDAFWLFNLKPLALRVRVMAARGELTEKHMTTTLRIAHLAGAHPISVSGATNCKITPGESRDVHVWQGNGISIVELTSETAPAKAYDTPKVTLYDAPISVPDNGPHAIYLDPTPFSDAPFSAPADSAPSIDTSGSGGSFDPAV